MKKILLLAFWVGASGAGASARVPAPVLDGRWIVDARVVELNERGEARLDVIENIKGAGAPTWLRGVWSAPAGAFVSPRRAGLREGGRYIFFLNGDRMTTVQPLYFTVGRSYIDQEFVVFPRNSYNRIAKSEFKKLIGQSVDAAERAAAGL
ncbi:MAG: hypothetical protein IPK56_03185 [Elusimicrobia bacterium]|nr:hypothetical protein [Elusimicrobiota bacterium]